MLRRVSRQINSKRIGIRNLPVEFDHRTVHSPLCVHRYNLNPKRRQSQERRSHSSLTMPLSNHSGNLAPVDGRNRHVVLSRNVLFDDSLDTLRPGLIVQKAQQSTCIQNERHHFSARRSF